jgi:enamine deaminase RidA (YjgF/YER057c/UK114 family)
VEIEVHASPGGGVALVLGDDGHGGITAPRHGARGHDGAVYLPTLLPIDADGEIVAEATSWVSTSTASSAGELLERAGLTLSHLVNTVDYSTPARASAPKSARAARLARPGVPRCCGHPHERAACAGVLCAIDAIASRHLPEVVNPGWSRYETLTYNPGLRAGNTLYMSGFASLDMVTQQATHEGDLRAQAEATYGAILETLAVVGAGPEHLLTTVEYVTPEGLGDYRVVADVRREMLRSRTRPRPASCAAACCAGVPHEVVPTAVIPDAGEAA